MLAVWRSLLAATLVVPSSHKVLVFELDCTRAPCTSLGRQHATGRTHVVKWLPAVQYEMIQTCPLNMALDLVQLQPRILFVMGYTGGIRVLSFNPFHFERPYKCVCSNRKLCCQFILSSEAYLLLYIWTSQLIKLRWHAYSRSRGCRHGVCL